MSLLLGTGFQWSHLHPDHLAKTLLASGFFLFIGQWLLRAFLRKTDIEIGYNWSFSGQVESAQFWVPNFDIRNKSRRRTYYVSNIAYFREGKPLHFDNEGLWGLELKPGSITFKSAPKPVPKVDSWNVAHFCEVRMRFQNGDEVVAFGGNLRPTRAMLLARKLRFWLDRSAVLPD